MRSLEERKQNTSKTKNDGRKLMMPGRDGASLMEENLGADGMRGAVLNPHKEELGLDGMGGNMHSSLRTKEKDLCEREGESR